jgi:hypothetical protein
MMNSGFDKDQFRKMIRATAARRLDSANRPNLNMPMGPSRPSVHTAHAAHAAHAAHSFPDAGLSSSSPYTLPASLYSLNPAAAATPFSSASAFASGSDVLKPVATVVAVAVLFFVLGEFIDNELYTDSTDERPKSYADVVIAVCVHIVLMIGLLALPYWALSKSGFCPVLLQWYIAIAAVWVVSLFAHHNFPRKLRYVMRGYDAEEEQQEEQQQQQQSAPTAPATPSRAPMRKHAGGLEEFKQTEDARGVEEEEAEVLVPMSTPLHSLPVHSMTQSY